MSNLAIDIKEFSVKIQEATTDSLNYLDRSNEEKNQWNLPTTSDGLEQIISRQGIPMTSNDHEDSQLGKMRPSASNTLEKSLKLLRNANQLTVFDQIASRTEAAPRQTG